MRKREKRDKLLLLTAVSGEIPADWIGEAVGSKDYGAALLTRLKKEGKIKLRSKDGIRGYLLRAKGKRYLLEMYGEDVERFLSGSGATNHVKSEPEKRLRLHRMSIVWVYFYRMGIAVFASDKPVLFPGFYPSPCKGLEDNSGTLGRKGDGEGGLERNGMDRGERELEGRGGPVQVRLLCSTQGRERLRTFLCGVLSQIRENPFGMEAGTDQNGRKVYFCYLLDLWQLKRIRRQCISHGGRVFCFTYQAQTVREIFGERFEVEAIRPEKVYRYLGWKES